MAELAFRPVPKNKRAARAIDVALRTIIDEVRAKTRVEDRAEVEVLLTEVVRHVQEAAKRVGIVEPASG